MSVTYCPVCGEHLIEREVAGRTRLACPSCGYVHFVNPVPVVGLIITYQDRIVVVKRGGSVERGKWALPSGYIEADESVEEAAIREAKEETGLDVELIEMVGVYSFPDGPPSSGIMIMYAARVIGGKLQAGDDAVDVRLFAPEDVPTLPFRTHRLAMGRWLHLLKERRNDSADQDEFTIRLAENADADAIIDLLRLNKDEDIDWRAVRQRFQESSAVQVFVAETVRFPHRIVGFVALSLVRTLTGARGWIDDMMLLPGFVTEEMGIALLEAAMQHGRRLNLTHLFVNTARGNENARAFYHLVGFQPSTINHLRIR